MVVVVKEQVQLKPIDKDAALVLLLFTVVVPLVDSAMNANTIPIAKYLAAVAVAVTATTAFRGCHKVQLKRARNERGSSSAAARTSGSSRDR